MAELQQAHSSSRYLTSTAAVHQSSTLQQPQPSAGSEAHTDGGVESQTDDAIESVLTSELDESSTACLPAFDSSRMTFDAECRECQSSFQYTKPDSLLMYLHAYRYQVRFRHMLTFEFTYLIICVQTHVIQQMLVFDMCYMLKLMYRTTSGFVLCNQ